MNLHEETLEAFRAPPEAETEIPLKVARPWTPLQCFRVCDTCTVNCLSRLLVVSDILHNTTSSRQAAWTCPVWKAITGLLVVVKFKWYGVCTPLTLKSGRYRREFEKSLPDIFEQFEIGYLA